MTDEILSFICDAIWGIPTVALIVGTGLYYTVKMGIPQITSLNSMLKCVKKNIILNKNSNPMRIISTALAATVGTGSITGVATAITLGGAGAVFWLWVSAFFGMAVSYAEGVISIKYRNGKKGGIMYAVKNGMKEPVTAAMYALFTVFASFGMGSMAQTNSAAGAIYEEFSVSPVVVGAIIAAAAALCVFSKNDFTGKLCAAAVPALSSAYILITLAVIFMNINNLPGVFGEIFSSAFGIKAAAGGAAGYAVKQAVSAGFKRGVFSNEAGLGTTAAIHAESDIKTAHEQGLINMFELIIDTFVICTLTALAILSSGACGSGLDGAALVTEACRTIFGGISGKIVAVCIAGFAAATVMGWSKIGLGAAQYLSGGKSAVYKAAFVVSAFLGSALSLDTVWKLSDIFNGLMIFPCMAALIALRKEILQEYHSRPVEPKPFSPLLVEGSSSRSTV